MHRIICLVKVERQQAIREYTTLPVSSLSCSIQENPRKRSLSLTPLPARANPAAQVSNRVVEPSSADGLPIVARVCPRGLRCKTDGQNWRRSGRERTHFERRPSRCRRCWAGLLVCGLDFAFGSLRASRISSASRKSAEVRTRSDCKNETTMPKRSSGLVLAGSSP